MANLSKSEILTFDLYIMDLDNTLIMEEDYLFQGYQVIASFLQKKRPVLISSQIYSKLIETFRREGRSLLFNRIIEEIGADPDLVNECVSILRTYTPPVKIELIPPMKEFLELLNHNKKPVYILTNGNKIQQQNKLENINWNGIEIKPKVVFANDYSPKPSPEGINHIVTLTNVDRNNVVMIGDSDSDRECALSAGINFIIVSELISTFK